MLHYTVQAWLPVVTHIEALQGERPGAAGDGGHFVAPDRGAPDDDVAPAINRERRPAEAIGA